MNRSFVLHAVKDVAIENRPTPKLKDSWDVIVQVAQTGICGSDVSFRFDPSPSRKSG
jgi:D-xylulose reductase